MNNRIIFLIIVSLSLISAPAAFAKEYDLSAEELFTFEQALFKQQRYPEAKIEFEKCLVLNPQNTKAKEFLDLCATKVTPDKEKAMLLALENMEKESKAKGPITAQTNSASAAPEELKGPAEQKEAPPQQEEELTEQEEALAPPVQKGAWTLKKDQLYTELYTQYYWANSQFNNGREKERWGYSGKYKEIMSQLKFEYGLTDRDTLLLYTTAKEATWKDEFRSSTRKGFTRIEPGIKHLLFTQPFIGTLQLKAKFPLNYSTETVPSLDQYHQIDIEPRLLTAQPWPKLPGYTKFELGFTYRAEKPSNEIPYYFEFGYNFRPFLILKASLDGKTAVGAGTKEDWLVYTVGPIFKIGDLFNIEFGYGDTITGRNTSVGKKIFTSLSRQW